MSNINGNPFSTTTVMNASASTMKMAEEAFAKASLATPKDVASQTQADPYFDLTKLLNIADDDDNASLSKAELEKASKIIDLNGDDKLSESEIELVNYIATKDGKKGISDLEAKGLSDIKNFVKTLGIELTPQTLEALKPVIDIFYHSYAPTATDLDGDKKIAKWEQHLDNVGISKDAEKLAVFKKIADSNADGKISEAEFNKVSPYLNINSDSKIDTNELKFIDYISTLDGKAGLNEKEAKIAQDAKSLLAEYKKQNGGVALELTDAVLTQANAWAKHKYGTTISPFEGTKMIDLDKDGSLDAFEKTAFDAGINTDITSSEVLNKIIDNNRDGKISETEFNEIKSLLDLNSDGKFDKNEIELLTFISQLDGKEGFQGTEKEINSILKNWLDEYKKTNGKSFAITDNVVADWKQSIQNYYNFNNKPVPNEKIIDLDKNGKIDAFEKTAFDKGISTDTATLEQMLKIADSSNDGKISQAELDAIMKYLDVDKDGKIEKSEIDLMAFIASLDGKNGIQTEVETAIAADYQTWTNPIEATDTFVASEKEFLKKAYDYYTRKGQA